MGASLVEICTAVMWNGISIIDKLTKGLAKYLEKHGFTGPQDQIGKALNHIGEFPDLDLSIKLVARIDQDQCNGCGICVKACDSGGYQAIEMNENIARIDVYKCDGCGLCVGVCPLRVVHLAPRATLD